MIFLKNVTYFRAKTKKKLFLLFYSGGHKTNFNALFRMLTLGHIFCSFSFVLVYISLIHRWRVKGTLSIKLLVLCPPELEFCGLRKTKKILKPKIIYDEQVFWSNSLDVYSNDILCLLYPILKPHPVYFKKTSAAPFGNRSPQLQGAWVCTWADLQNLQGGAAPTHQTETRWTEKEIFLCLSTPLVKTPHFGRLLFWMGLARYSPNYSGC